MSTDEWYEALLEVARRRGVYHYVSTTLKDSWIDSYYYDDETPESALDTDLANSGLEL